MDYFPFEKIIWKLIEFRTKPRHPKVKLNSTISFSQKNQKICFDGYFYLSENGKSVGDLADTDSRFTSIPPDETIDIWVNQMFENANTVENTNIGVSIG